jgi:Holliday junction resolvasome RuvABC DNA-binding subunit|tara:strand:- start:440 stop:847 length:408 start_codon:yes stop_codon:yes gene_type:complete
MIFSYYSIGDVILDIVGGIAAFIVLCAWGVASVEPKKKQVETKKPKRVQNNAKPAQIKPIELELVFEYDESDKTKPKPKPVPKTSEKIIEEAVFALHNLGFKKTEAKKAIERVSNGRVFDNVQDLIVATMDRTNV